MRILVVEDEKKINDVIVKTLKKEKYGVDSCFDGEEALDYIFSVEYDIILLDIMLPKKDGFEVCREIRSFSNVPIIMITARGEDYEKIMGLEIGADDYIVKPFSPGEIIARIHAILRRLSPKENQDKKLFKYDNLEIDLDNFAVKIENEKILLTKKEIEIFWTLATNQNKVFTRENLLDLLWGFDYFGDSRTVDTHIKRLRSKIDNYNHPNWNIKTIWGVGYKFDILEN